MRKAAAIVVATFLVFVVCAPRVKCEMFAITPEEEEAVTGTALSSLARHNFLVGIASVGVRYENHTRCGKELETLLNAVAQEEFWSLKVLDSFGVPPKTFSWGNYFWFAAPQFCEDLNRPYRISLGKNAIDAVPFNIFNVTSPFPLRFTAVYMNFSTPHYVDLRLPYEYTIHVGLCLPASCAAGALRRYADLYFQSGVFETQHNFALELRSVDVRTPAFSWNFFRQTGTIVFGFILLSVILLTVLAEIVQRSKNNLTIQQKLLTKTTTAIPPIPTVIATTPQSLPTDVPHQQHTHGSACEEFVLCFRLGENYRRAMRLENCAANSSFLGVIAGIRSIICLWVTVFHVYYYSLFAMSNAPLTFAKLENFALQPVMQACFYVDVFFVISAFLLVYNFLSNEAQVKEIQQNDAWKNLKAFGKMLLQRYLRLTPVLIITILLSDMVYDFLNMYSPFRLGVHSGIYCKRTWWYNLLYIHNFLDMRDICCSWTWYLGCEMQYFILFTALLFLYAKSERVAKIVFATLTLGFAVIGWLCNYHNGVTFQVDVIHSTLNQIYVKPWVRINPYMGGAIFGWLLHQHQQRLQQCHSPQHRHHTSAELQEQQTKHRSHWRAAWPGDAASWRAVFWFFCAFIYLATNFMSYWRTTPTWLVATIMSFGKLLFALCVGAVIVLCACGHGGHLNALLSARPFLFLNKFCYGIYMLASIIVIVAFGLRNEATNFTEVSSGTDFIAVIILSIVAAFLLTLLLELPVQRITNRFLKRRRQSVVKQTNGVQ